MKDEQASPTFYRSWLFRAPLIMIAWVLVLRMGWGWYVQTRLDRQVRELADQGYRIDFEEIGSDDDEVENNVAITYMNATNSIGSYFFTGAAHPPMNNCPPYPNHWWTAVEAAEKLNANAISKAHAARLLNEGAWSDHRKRHSFPGLFYPYRTRPLAEALSNSAIWNHLKGNTDVAMERVLDILSLSRWLREGSTTSMQAVASEVDLVAARSLHILLSTKFVNGPGRVARWRLILSQILDEEKIWSQVPESILNVSSQVQRDVQRDVAQVWLIRPLNDRGVSRDLGRLPGMVNAFSSKAESGCGILEQRFFLQRGVQKLIRRSNHLAILVGLSGMSLPKIGGG